MTRASFPLRNGAPVFVLWALGLCLSTEAWATKQWTDRDIEKAVEKVSDECLSSMGERAPMPKVDCNRGLGKLAKLGDRAVPIVARGVLAQTRKRSEYDTWEAPERTAILVGLLQKINTPAAVAALVELTGNAEIQKSRLRYMNQIHQALLRCTSAPIKGDLKTEDGRAKLAAAWQKWWQEQDQNNAQAPKEDPGANT